MYVQYYKQSFRAIKTSAQLFRGYIWIFISEKRFAILNDSRLVSLFLEILQSDYIDTFHKNEITWI